MAKSICFDPSDLGVEACKQILEQIDLGRSKGLVKVVGNPMDLAQINRTWYVHLRFRQSGEFYQQLEWKESLQVKSLRSHPRGKIALIFGYGNE